MGILEPLALFLLPALAAVVALYLLRFRRPVAPVPSVALWDRAQRDREANTLWQRLRVSVLMLLQLLVLLLLIVAVARPWTLGSGERVRASVLVVDVSASMSGRAAPDAPDDTRIGSARREALSIVDGMDGSGVATLIVAGAEPGVLVPATGDKARLRAAIRGLEAQPVRGDMLSALRLAASITSGRADSAIYVVSDGAFSGAAERVQLTGQKLVAKIVGVPDSDQQPAATGNQGITSMSLIGGIGVAPGLFVQVANSAPITVTRRVEVSVDDVPWEARTLELGSGQTLAIEIVNVPAEGRVLHARLSGSDALPLDDSAWVVSRANAPISILLVSEGNKFLEVALSLLPSVSLYRVLPNKYDPAANLQGKPFDVTVVDAGVPITTLATLPPGNLLVFSPLAPLPGITVTGAITRPLPIAPRRDPVSDAEKSRSPLSDARLDVAGLTNANIARAARLQLDSSVVELLSSDKGPLIAAGEKDGRRIAVVAFALGDTDLPLQAAFPIMMRDLVGLLRPDASGGLPAAIEPLRGARILPVTSSVTDILIEDPSGKEWILPADPEGVTFAQTGLPGAYYVTQYAGDKVAWQGAFAVNLFSRDESLLPPIPSALSALERASRSVRGAGIANTEIARSEIWPTFAILALLLLLGEWAYANRIAIRRAVTEARARRTA